MQSHSSAQFATEDPASSVLRWVSDTLGERAVIVSSLGPQTLVILELLHQLRRSLPVMMIDTGFLFDETVALAERVELRYGIEIIIVRANLTTAEQAAKLGDRLWEREPDRCCSIRKVHPLREALKPYDAWVTGLRRDQSASRAAIQPVMWDPAYGILKVNPLASWSRADLELFQSKHGIELNPLLQQGFQSVGCTHCTTPASGVERSGRWQGTEKTECGIHHLFPTNSENIP